MSVSASDYVHLDVEEVLRETDKALHVLLEGGEEVWLPKSQVKDAGDYRPGDRGCTMSITEWLAREKGFDT